MTFKEKLQMEHPEYVDEKFGGGLRGCPYHYGYEKNLNCMFWESDEKCAECWNREMPGAEPSEKEFDIATKGYSKGYSVGAEDGYNKGFEDGMSEGLTQGQNDVWELVKKLCDMNCKETKNVFGVSEGLYDITRNFTPQEALAKLKAYEDSKIEVGDEVFCKALTEFDDRANKENYGVVTGIYSDHYEILMKNGDTTGFKLKECEKTGKHIDIKSILESIGE